MANIGGFNINASQIGSFMSHIPRDQQFAGPVVKEYRNPVWFFSRVTIICRALGLLFMFAMWSIALSSFMCIGAAVILLVLASAMVILETSWFLNKFNICNQPGLPNRIYMALSWFDTWRKAILYGITGIVCFILAGISCPGVYIAGVFCIVLAGCNLAKAYRFSRIEPLSAVTPPGAVGASDFTAHDFGPKY